MSFLQVNRNETKKKKLNNYLNLKNYLFDYILKVQVWPSLDNTGVTFQKISVLYETKNQYKNGGWVPKIKKHTVTLS